MLYTEFRKFITYYKQRRLHSLEDYGRILDYFLDTFTKVPHNSKDITIDPVMDNRNLTLYFNAWTRKFLFMIKGIIRFCIKWRKFINILIAIACYGFMYSYLPFFYHEYYHSFPKLKGFFLYDQALFDVYYYYRYLVIAFFSYLTLKIARIFFLLTKYYMNEVLGISDEEILDNLAHNVPEEEKLRNGFVFFCCYVLVPWFYFLNIICNPPLYIYIEYTLQYFFIMALIIIFFLVRGRLTLDQQYDFTRSSFVEDQKNFSITYMIGVFYGWSVVYSFQQVGAYLLEFFLHMLAFILS